MASWYAQTLVDRPTYRAHSYGLLKSILETGVKDGLLSANPCQIDGAGSVKSKTQAVIPTVEQLSEIAEKIQPKFRALILISAWCGLRFGEVIELRRKDIGENAEIISVARGVTHRTAKQAGLGGDRCIISTPCWIRRPLTRHVLSPTKSIVATESARLSGDFWHER